LTGQPVPEFESLPLRHYSSDKLEAAPRDTPQRLNARKATILAALATTPFAWKAAAATGLSAGAIATAVGVLTVIGALGFAGYQFGNERLAAWLQLPSIPADAPQDAAAPELAQAALNTTPTPAEVPAPAAEPGKGRIWGKVMDINGTPVPKATVQIELVDWEETQAPPSAAKRIEAISDAAGAYAYEGLAYGIYSVFAFGGNTVDVVRSRLDAEIAVREEDLYLKPGLPVAGRVVSTSGAPVPGAVIVPHVYAPMGPVNDHVVTSAVRVVSDDQGRFKIGLIWPGGWQFMARAPGYAATVSDMIESGTQTATITLLGGGSVTGHLLRADSLTPVAGLIVQLNPTSGASGARQATSGDDGTFTIADLAPGTYKPALISETAALKDAPAEITIASGAETPLELLIGGGGTLSGRVYDATTGEGVQGASVSINSADQGNLYRDVLTDATGGYFFPILPDGSYRINTGGISGYFTALEADDQERLVVLSGEREIEVNIPVTKGIKLSGTVVDADGQPVPGANVEGVAELLGGQRRDHTYTDAKDDGRFECWIRKASPTVTLTASHKERLSMPMKLGEVGPQGRSGLVLRLERLAEATVEAKIDTKGLEKYLAALLLEANLFQRVDGGSNGNSVRIAPNGVATFKNVLPGQYYIYVTHNNFGTSYCESEDFTVPPGNKEVAFSMPCIEGGTATIAGRVMNESGEPIAGAKATMFGAEGVVGEVATDAEGRFLIENVPLRNNYLSVTAAGHLSKTVGVASDGTEIEVRLAVGTYLYGRVVDAETGEPVPLFELHSLTHNGEYSEDEAMRILLAQGGSTSMSNQGDGRFCREVRFPGVTQLAVHARDYLVGQATVRDPSAETVEIRLQRGGTMGGTVTTPEGQPLSGVLISTMLTRPYDPPSTVTTTTSDIQGEFTITNIAPGVPLFLRHQAYAVTRYVVPATGPMAITMDPGAALTGKVLPWPMAGARVVVMSSDASPDFGNPKTSSVDDNGTFRIEKLPAGNVTVSLTVEQATLEAIGFKMDGYTPVVANLISGMETNVVIDMRSAIGPANEPPTESTVPDPAESIGNNDVEQVDAPLSNESP
jgi:uncharacterized GH25 family protein